MKKTISKLSYQLNLPEKVIINAYKSYWMHIREKIESLPLKEDLTEEQFNALKVNFNIPFLGKLFCTYDRWKKLKEINNDKHKESKTNV